MYSQTQYMKNELSKIKTKDLLKELKGRGIDLYTTYVENEKTFKELLKDHKDKKFVKYFEKNIFPTFQKTIMSEIAEMDVEIIWDIMGENCSSMRSPKDYIKSEYKIWKNKK